MEILLGTTLTFSNALYSRKLCLQQKKKKKKKKAQLGDTMELDR